MLRRAIPITTLLAAALVSAIAGWPAAAQFGQIFRDDPPRPPGNVPGVQRDPGPPPSQQQPAQRPPGLRPPSGAVQSQPLPPPPGGAAAPQRPEQTTIDDLLRGSQPDNGTARAPAQPLPGLPPGQRQPRGQPQPADTAPQPGDEVVVAPPAVKIANPTAVFTGLDKITGRTITFDVAINETVQFGALQVTPRVCYSRPPTETPNTDAFISVDELTLQGDRRRIFSGWVFAASPGLNAIEHPVYDVWLVDCKGGDKKEETAEAKPDAKPAAAPAPPARPPQRRSTARPPQPNLGPLLPPFR